MLLIFLANTHGLFACSLLKNVTATNSFQKVFDDFDCKQSRVNKGSEFYKKLISSWLKDNNTDLNDCNITKYVY